MNNPTPVAILVRVSTLKQETKRQITELAQYAQSKGYTIVETCKETVSGDTDADARSGLKRVQELAESGAIKKVLVSEISRIARRNSTTHRFVEQLEEAVPITPFVGFQHTTVEAFERFRWWRSRQLHDALEKLTHPIQRAESGERCRRT